MTTETTDLQRTSAWHEARKGRVTASIAGAILGLAPYMTRADAMRVMVREALGAEREFVGNVATEYGTYHESGALTEYRMDTMHEVTPAPFVAYEDWLGASPDGYVENYGLLEIKCPYGLRKAPAGTPVPFKPIAEQPHYYAQVQVQLLATDRMWCHFYQWAPGGSKLELVKVDHDWRNENLPKLRQFYAEYLDELKNNPGEYLAPERAIIDTPEAARMIGEWDAVNEQLELLAERKKDLLADMVRVAGEKNSTFAGRKLTYTERAGAVAYAKVVKDHCRDVDLEPYRGKASQFWQVR